MVICGRGEPSPATAQVLRFGTKANRVIEEKDTLCHICQSAVELDNVFENAQAVKGRATWLERPDPALDPRLNCMLFTLSEEPACILGGSAAAVRGRAILQL